MKNILTLLLLIATYCHSCAFNLVDGFIPYKSSDTWVSEMRDYTSDYINGLYPISLAQYRAQSYVSYDSGNPTRFYIARNDIVGCCKSYKNVAGAKFLVVTKTATGGPSKTPYQKSRRGGPYPSERESMDAFDALCSKLGIVNYYYSSINVQNLLDLDTGSIGLTTTPIFGIFRLPDASEYDVITDWKAYLRGHCITDHYPQSFISGDWEQSWKDLTRLATIVIADETVKENEQIISEVEVETPSYQRYYVHKEGVIARFRVPVRDMFFRSFTHESDNDSVKHIDVISGNIFIDQDCRICMKESTISGNPMMQFVAEDQGTLSVESIDSKFTCWMTVSGVNTSVSTTSLKLDMNSGDSITICGDCIIRLFEFTSQSRTRRSSTRTGS